MKHMKQLEEFRAGSSAAVKELEQLQGWKFMSCSHGQEMGQLAVLASDWLFTLVQPIRRQLAC